MTNYLARLKAQAGKKCLSEEPTKLTKPFEGGGDIGSVSFDSDLGTGFSRSKENPAPIWTEAHEERAAIAEYDGGAPREWTEGFAILDRARPPDDVPARRWLQFIGRLRHVP